MPAAIVGLLTVGLSQTIGWVAVESFFQSFMLGFAGALGGYIAKKSTDYIIRKFKNRKSKIKKIDK